MSMHAEIIDTSVLSEIFSAYSEDELKQWGLPDFQTTSVQVSSMKRVFVMERTFTEGMSGIRVTFKSPKNELASCLTYESPLRKGDKLIITYTITAYGDNNGHVRIRMPGGKCLRVNLYAAAA